MRRRDLIYTLPTLAAAPALGAGAKGAAKARLRTAICAYSFRSQLKNGSMTYDDLVHMAVDLGLDGLDLTVYWFPNTTNKFLMPLRNLAIRNGVPIYSISVRTDMCQPTAELQAAEVDGVNKWVDVAAKLGAGHIRVFGGKVPKGRTEDEAAGWVAEILKRSAEYAGSKGVILGLENHGGITLRLAEQLAGVQEALRNRAPAWATVYMFGVLIALLP